MMPLALEVTHATPSCSGQGLPRHLTLPRQCLLVQVSDAGLHTAWKEGSRRGQREEGAPKPVPQTTPSLDSPLPLQLLAGHAPPLLRQQRPMH